MDKQTALGYGRVSTPDQADYGSSRETQEEKIQRFCAERDLLLVELYFDVGSGADVTERPEYLRLLRNLHEHGCMVAQCLDRVGRSVKEIVLLLDYLSGLRKALWLVETPIDSQSELGEVMIILLASVAQLELKAIQRRTVDGKERKAASGGYTGGSPPYGWAAIDGQLMEVPAEQRVIRRCEQLRDSGYTYRQIAEDLAVEGFTTKRGGQWRASMVQKIIRRSKCT